MDINELKPSPDLYLQARIGFIKKGTTFGAWCRENGIQHTNAKAALVGAWNGPKGREVRRQLLIASGLTNPSQIPA